MSFDTIQRAISDFRHGKMVVVVDDEDRENEGDLCLAAEKVTPELVNFMAKHARGLICLALTEERLKTLALPMMVAQNQTALGTAFTVSIEARHGVTTGISAHDRARTIQVAVADGSGPDDLVRPGHIFPLQARPGGVLVRTGHTEAGVDLARLAGLKPASVICEIMNDDGTMARLPDLQRFAAAHDLALVTIADLIEYRVKHESLVKSLAVREVVHPVWGDVTLHAYGTTLDARQHLVVVKGDILGEGEAPLVRVHAGYPLSHVFGDLFSSDRTLLNAALAQLGREPRAVLLCLDQGTPPVPLSQRIERLGKDDDAPSGGIQREVGLGAQILRDLGLTRIRVLTGNPRKLLGIEGYGLQVVEAVPLDLGQVRGGPRPKLEVV